VDHDQKTLGELQLPPHETAVDLPNFRRQYPSTKSKVSFSEVAAMLREAGAPLDKAIKTLPARASTNKILRVLVQHREIQALGSPEARLEALCCYNLAQCINHPLAYRPTIDGGLAFREKGKKTVRPPLDRASDAINELRRVLPMIINPFEEAMSRAERHCISPPSTAQEMRQLRDDALNRLDTFKKIFALIETLPNRARTSTPWRFDGAKLLEVYRLDIDPAAGISPQGPALKFIRLALQRIGYINLPASLRSGLYKTAKNWREQVLLRIFEDYI
jgi:hypothetical protein